ncbi:MAG: hypothetical protein CBD51_005760 [Flavobacteriales bacterium TMED191]|nr:MAG: hypothetical protein CBD51_005760 [Flavobacteriales bacterium TMED191]
MNKLPLILLSLVPFFVFSQCVSGDCTNGQGEYKYKNGTYTGDFVDGTLTGNGLFKSRKGYTYSGNWNQGEKNKFGEESFKRGHTYKGEFASNLKHGNGTAWFPSTRFIDEIVYTGEWSNDVICGEGELSYVREVKYGRSKKIEKNKLKGTFVNGVFQGRLTEEYEDEILWSSFGLKSEDFRYYKRLSERDYKKLKNPAAIEGSIILSCECLSGFAIFEGASIFRKNLSWWSSSIPPKTKSIILASRQREFDIIQWHAKELEIELNKKKLPCNNESILIAWEALSLKERECVQIRKNYSVETAWNPKKGGAIKNPVPQQKWNNRIQKKLDKTEKVCQKVQSKIRKRLEKKDDTICLSGSLNPATLPQKVVSKEELVENKKIKDPIELRFVRNSQLH